MPTLVQNELDQYLSNGVVNEIIGLINTGKEAAVYLAVSEGKRVAIKVFKDRNNRNFRDRSDYFMPSFAPHRRAARAMKNKSNFGRRVEEGLWQSREVKTLRLLHDSGADVPKVLAVSKPSISYNGTYETYALFKKLGVGCDENEIADQLRNY